MAEITPTASPAGMLGWQRRIVLTMLVGLLAFVATLVPAYDQSFQRLQAAWGSYVVFALPCLLATWAALRRQPLVTRLPWGLGLAAGLGLVLAWANTHLDPDPTDTLVWLVIFPAATLLLTGLLTIVRRRAGWRIGLEQEWAEPETRGSQFTLRRLLAWMAVVAVILSLARWIGTGPSQQESPATWDTLIPMVIMIGVGAVWLLQLIPCVGVSLSPTQRWKFAAWLLGLGLLESLLLLAIKYLTSSVGPTTGGFLPLLIELAIDAGLLELGFLLSVLGVLGILRGCGYRLSRRTAPVVAAPVTAATQPMWRTPFPYLVATLGLLALALIWPALRIEQGRRQARVESALRQQFEQHGATASISDGQLWDLTFLADEPLQDATLQLAQQICCGQQPVRWANFPLQWDLSNRQVSDAQLVYLRDLPLSQLDLSGNPLTDAGLEPLTRLQGLLSLDLSRTQVTDAGLEQLQGCEGLQGIYLDGTSITDAGLRHLQGLKHLAAFSAANTQVTEEGKAALLQVSPNCRELQSSPMSTNRTPVPLNPEP